MADPLDYDPFSESVMEDPYPTYQRLRNEAPVYFLRDYNAWALSRFDDIWQASTDARRLTVTRGNTPGQILTRTQPVTPMFGLDDPPRHTQIRSRIRGSFQPAAVARAEPLIRSVVADAFARAESGRIEVVHEIGLAISVRVALMLIGVPIEDAGLMLELTERFFARDPKTRSITSDGIAAAGEMQAYFEDLIRARRKAGATASSPGAGSGSGSSLGSASALDQLLAVEIDGQRLRDEEITGSLQLLVHGGTETMPKVLATTLKRLFEHPDQCARVVADPTLCEWAFRESLRLDMPTQFLGRTALESLEIRGQQIEAGQAVIFLYASANRDEAEFEAPDRFDIDRRPDRILSFGHGVHACLGRNVALLEGRVALEEILARAPTFELDLKRATRYRTEFVHGYDQLPLHAS